MPTAAQLKSARKKLRKVPRPNNAPKLPNSKTYDAMKKDPVLKRKKEAIELIREMIKRRNEYMKARNKLKKLVVK